MSQQSDFQPLSYQLHLLKDLFNASSPCEINKTCLSALLHTPLVTFEMNTSWRIYSAVHGWFAPILIPSIIICSDRQIRPGPYHLYYIFTLQAEKKKKQKQRCVLMSCVNYLNRLSVSPLVGWIRNFPPNYTERSPGPVRAQGDAPPCVRI